MKARYALALLLTLSCSSDPQPVDGDRPPPVGLPYRLPPGDPTATAYCGSSLFGRPTGACLELTGNAIGFSAEGGAMGEVAARASSGKVEQSRGGYIETDQALDFGVPQASYGADQVSFTVTDATTWAAARLTLRWSVHSVLPATDAQGNPAGMLERTDHWYWRASSGSAACRMYGRRWICDLRDLRFVLRDDPERDGGPPPSTAPSPIPATFDARGFIHVFH